MITLSQTKTALAINLTASFLASGGTSPYTYSVLPNGAGGTINSSTGVYTAPTVVNNGSFGPPRYLYDTIQAVDHVGAIAKSQILVGTPLLLFCDIIQNQMGLAPGRVYLWDQKIMEPSDSGLFIPVSILRCRPFGNTNSYASSSGLNSNQSVNMYAELQVDVISRDTEARDRKEEIIMALNSDYSQSQQEGNSFYIGKLPPSAQFVNLSNIDGAAIPYRFSISVAMQYFVSKTLSTQYFSTFETVQETVQA